MNITGEALIGGLATRGRGAAFAAMNASTQQSIAPSFNAVDAAQIDAACTLAGATFDAFRATTSEQRAVFLESIAAQISAIGDDLIVRAMTESGLPRARLEGERGRTIGQLKLFVDLLRDGRWRDVRIDSALPARVPPRPELRMHMIGIGPVAVFAASNFPLAFSVGGGDTASALAAGCPVIVKAHSAHPGTSELVARAILAAAQICQLPPGVFALLTGTGNGIGQALVSHPAIKAVGFTGSRAGGLALMAAAAARPQPIPVYAEMSSINPMFLLPHALATRGNELASGFAASLTMGVGQFCTNPGLVLAIRGNDFTNFCNKSADALSGTASATMLTAGIATSFQRSTQKLASHPHVSTLLRASASEGCAAPALFSTTGAAFRAEPALHEEMFGPAAVLVGCEDEKELIDIAASLEGQLTATLQIDDDDIELAQKLLPILERKVGRILANGFPTGVEVVSAMVHGGPFPATSDGRSTSVGTAAIQRFLRPVSYQNLPAALLPENLRDVNL